MDNKSSTISNITLLKIEDASKQNSHFEMAVPQKWNVKSSIMAKNTNNPIRKIVDGMKLTPNPKKEMIALSIGDPTVFGNLPPDENVIEAVKTSLETGRNNGYAPSIGYKFARQAVADAHTIPEAPLTSEDVILTSGGSGALELCINVLANPGQNILVPRPGFSIYQTLAESLGINVKSYVLQPNYNWNVDIYHLEDQIDDQTAAIVVNNPSNPCGSVYTAAHLKEILNIADRYKVPIISDEIYANFVFPGNTYHSLASQTKTVPILTCGGTTKRWLVPGWRMGWILIHDRDSIFTPEIRLGLVSLSQKILGANTIIQGALPDILTKTTTEFFENTLKHIQLNAITTFSKLKSVPGLTPVMPRGAMYMMVGYDSMLYKTFRDEMHFTEALVTEQSVFCLPGRCFKFPGFFRIVLTVPHDKMKEACNRISEFCYLHISKEALPKHPLDMSDEEEEYED